MSNEELVNQLDAAVKGIMSSKKVVESTMAIALKFGKQG
jgi:hypothetical protein